MRLPISEIVAARPEIEPRTFWCASQELNHYTTIAPAMTVGLMFRRITAHLCLYERYHHI